MMVTEWFKGLGARQTPDDPTGRKHQMGFIGFVVAMLVLITALVVIQANRADATTQCRGPISGTKGLDPPSVTLTVNRWCGYTTSLGSWRFDNFNPPGFSRTYAESPTYNFDRWFDTKTYTGVGTAPNGTSNVQFKAYWIAGEFELRFPPYTHSYPHGVRIWAWANGNYTVKGTSVVPYLPMPRP